jgi:hypothetical protein
MYIGYEVIQLTPEILSRASSSEGAFFICFPYPGK